MTIRYLILTGVFSILYACARQTTPDGGPKDLAPPKLMRSSPSNNEKNFKEKILTFYFSEQVKLKEPKEEIIITPEPAKNLFYLAKQNRITIESKTAWKDSTTYSIAFREAIQDITESNPIENLRIAFSTGSIIDSLTLHGKIVDALTEKIPQKITVAIHQSDTFNIFQHAPSYFTKTDKNGRFVITNLKPGSYKVYAFDDKNKNLKVETKTEPFGFYPGWVTLKEKVDTLQLILISMDSRPIRLTNVRHTDKFSTVKFNKSLVTYSAHIPNKSILNAFGDDQSEIKFFHHLTPPDSLPVTLQGTDSLNQKIDTLFYIKAGTNASIKEAFKYELLKPDINAESAVFTATVTINKPILKINFDSIFFKIDTLNRIPFTPLNIQYDTANNKIQIHKELDKKILGRLTAPLEFYIGTATFISIENDSSKKVSKRITQPKPEDTATLLLEVQTSKTDYEIQLITTDYKIIQTARNAKKITFKNVPPAEYKIRIYLDQNNNNKWDPGNINLDIPPEPTFFYKNEAGKYQFPLRANWQVGPYKIVF